MIRSFSHPDMQLLSRRLDGMLSPRASGSLDAHIQGCAACAVKLQALTDLKRSLRSLPVIDERAGARPPMARPSSTRPVPWARRGVPLGGAVALALLAAGAVAFRPTTPPMRIISSGPQVVTSDGILRPPLQSDTALRTLPNMTAGYVDLEIPGQLLLRLKAGTTVTWQQVNRTWFSRRPHIVVNLMRGELLARTKESFWGSRLELRTPTATTMVKGTAFALKVDPSQDTTTVKVLAGSVFFSPYLGGVGVKVGSGQMSRIQAARLPDKPKMLTAAERQALLEAYRIGQDPVAALVIGDGPERVEELMRPALLYLSRRKNPDLHHFLRKAVDKMNNGALRGDDPALYEGDIRILEMAVESMRDRELAVPLRLLLGAYTANLNDPVRSRAHFYWVADQFPRDSRASLALAAAARVAEKQLKNMDSAREAHRFVLSRYPKSPEAELAREFLRKNPR